MINYKCYEFIRDEMFLRFNTLIESRLNRRITYTILNFFC